MAEKPNIILIVTDQFRGDCVGASGNAVIRTPTIDSMIRTGHYFTHARTELTSCVGARRTIESGQTPSSHKMIGYYDSIPWHEKNTLAYGLKDAGYHTINIGKRHNFPRVGEEGLAGYQYNKQYEEWRNLNDGFHDDYHQFLQENDRWYYGPFATSSSNNSFMGDVFPLEERFHPSSWVAREGCQAIDHWAKNEKEKPFFMHLSFSAPHPPFTPPNKYYQEYINKVLPKPLQGDGTSDPNKYRFRGRFFQEADKLRLSSEEIHRSRAAYYGLINHIDSCIHQVLFYMNREFRNVNGQGVLDNTIVLLTADHGEMLGDFDKFNKQVGFEGSVRIPFVVNLAPKLFKDKPVGKRYKDLVGNQDILPTLFSLAGVPIPKSSDGLDLTKVIFGESKRVERELLFGEHYAHMQYVVSKEYKYIWNYDDDCDELYDLINDPHEQKNVFDHPDHLKRGKELQSALIEHLKPRGDMFLEGGKLRKPKLSLIKWLESQGQSQA